MDSQGEGENACDGCMGCTQYVLIKSLVLVAFNLRDPPGVRNGKR